MNFSPAHDGSESTIAPIALMGMACRFPGGSNTPESFWRHLLSGRSAIGEIPSDRFSIAAHVDANAEAPGKSYSRWGGFIDDIAGFDAAMFEISPREALTMDPQQRLLLMVAYEAMENAGLTRAGLGAVRTGVYVGVSSADYAAMQRLQRTFSDVYSGTGSALSIVANRISHRFNLKGPSLSIDTACSSSLVALDQAVTALASGKIDIAIVAGAHLLIDPSPFVAFSKAGMLSPTGQLSAFDRRANGYVRGEGIGAVLLMRESDALFQARRPRALIRATASNQDGRTPTLTAPDASAQRAMMRQLVSTAGIAAHDVDYVEAHGTGTPVGDPIEAAAIGHVFGGALRAAPLLFGSVKPNIGHLEASAGIASLIKAVLSLEHRRVPASLNSDEPNPAIAFAAYNMMVPQTVTSLGTEKQPLFIAVNSFGFGGTNAGVLLESAGKAAADVDAKAVSTARNLAIPLSAGSPEALAAMAGQLHVAIASGPLAGRSMPDLATSLGALREGLSHRATIIAGSEASLRDSLLRLAASETQSPVRGAFPAIVTGQVKAQPRLAFTFAGQGGQWQGMARRLLLDNPAFANAFGEFDRLFENLSGWSVRDELLRKEAESRLHQSRFAMPAIFGVQLGLSAFWRSRGLAPDYVIGHSFGELAAAHLAGAIDLETATRMIHVRCQIREKLGRDGAMLAVGMGAAEIATLLGRQSEIDIAAINTDAMVTLAGPVDAVAALADRLKADLPDLLVRSIQSDTAWHSRQLAPLEDWFRTEIGDVAWRTPEVPFVSTVTGRVEARLDADYWWHNLRRPVRYRDAVMMALDLGANGFLELSPHRVLSGLNATNAAERGSAATIANSLVRQEDDYRALAVAMGQLHVAGVSIDWRAAGGGISLAQGLPTYPWQVSPYWRQSEEMQDVLQVSPVFALLGKRERGPDPIWANEISLGAFPYLKDHVVDADVVFPAAGYLEMMLSAGREVFGEATLELEEFEIASALIIGAAEHILVSTRFDPVRHDIQIRTRTRDGAADWKVRAKARLRPTDIAPELMLPQVEATETETLTAEAFYAQTVQAGFGYGPAFRGVIETRSRGQFCSGEIVLPSSVLLDDSVVHPSLLDSAMQLALPIIADDPALRRNEGGEAIRYVPKGIKRLRLSGNLPKKLSAHAQVVRDPDGALRARYRLAEQDGHCRLVIEGMELIPFGRQRVASDTEAVRPAYYAETYVPFELAERTGAEAECLVLVAGEASKEERAGTVHFAQGIASQVLPVDALGDENLLLRCRKLVASLLADAGRVVFDARTEHVTDDTLVATSERLTLQLIATAQALQMHVASGAVGELVILTHGARRLPTDPPMTLAGLAATPLIGLVRTIATENPELRVVQIDALHHDLTDLTRMLDGGAGDETELICRDGVFWVPRLVAETRADLPRGTVEIDPASLSDTYALTMKMPGSTSGLFIEATPQPKLAPDEVLVEVAAVGLNFRDVMAVTGLLPLGAEPDPAWLNLGLEFSGTVRYAGSAVETLLPGDRVMGMGRGSLRGMIAASAVSLSKLPAGLGFDEAATIPSVFATAHYALVHVGRLAQGERVLIHLGTGGVGLAAIQVAKAVGAEIFATAGSEEKRDYLRGLGIEHVFNSRSLGFADDIVAATDGEGVDVVLNALSGHYIAKGLELLAPFGRFLEIGKRDVYDDTPLGMHGLRSNISFNVIDLAAMGAQRPERLAVIMAEVLQRLEHGTYQPLPVTRYPIERAAEAFDLMARGRHIGKVVIGLAGGRVRAQARADRELVARADRSYLVTGGTNGFGVEVARRLSRHGAGHIILASRSGTLGPQHADLAHDLETNGSSLEAISLDLTDAAGIEAFVTERMQSSRPIAGVVHGAAIFRDGLLGQLDEQQILAVLRPKMAGAWALHRALAKTGTNLDFFLSLSSVAQVLGSLGQANYVAANSFLEGFAAYRANHGLAAQTVSLGALAEVGFVADNSAMGSYLDSLGILPMSTAETLELLDGFAASSAVSRSAASIDWARVQSATGRAGMAPRLAGLMPGARKGDRQLRQLLQTLPVANWAAVLQDFLVDEVSRVLDVEPQAVPVARPLAELGLDSLSSIELKNRIEAKLVMSLTVSAFLQAPTLEKLASVIAGTLEGQLRSEREVVDSPDTTAAVGPENAQTSLQQWAIRLALAPMTSAAGKAALELSARRPVEADLEFVELEDRLTQLSDLASLLTISWDKESQSLRNGPPPSMSISSDLAQTLAEPLDLEHGQLMRLVAVVRDGRVTEIGVRVHLALGVAPPAILDALLTGDAKTPGWNMPPGTDELRRSQEAASRALLEPWTASPPLPGATLATLGCLHGLNIGRSAHLPVLETKDAVPEHQALHAFARAIGSLCDCSAVTVERFGGAFAQSTPLRLLPDLDSEDAEKLTRHQLALADSVLDTSALELLMGEELDRAGSSLRQFGFSARTDLDPAPPAWNALALQVVTSGDTTGIVLTYDPGRIGEASVAMVAAQIRQSMGEVSGPTASFAPVRASGLTEPAGQVLPVDPAFVQHRQHGFPVTPTLANLLDTVTHPAATATLRRASILCQGVRVRPGVDVPRLRRAVGMLAERHDFLRANFARQDGQWQALIEGAVAPLSIHDLTEAADAEFEARVSALADHPYDVERSSLFEVHLLRLGGRGDVVMVRLFEGIADGWSLGIVLDELLKAYIGLDLGARPPNLAQILRLATSASGPTSALISQPTGTDHLKLGPNRIRTLHLRGVDVLRRRAKVLGTTENGLLAAAFARALAEAGCGPLPKIGTYDPARSDPKLHRAVAFLSRLVPLNIVETTELLPLARRLDEQFLHLAGQTEIVGTVPDFIYSPLLPRQMLDQTLFGAAMRQFSKGQVSMMSLEVESLDLAPTGLQEGRLQLRPLALEASLDLRLHYALDAFSDAEIASLGRSILAHAGLPGSIVEKESLSDVLGAPEDVNAFSPAGMKS